jgi:hypothetical protein
MELTKLECLPSVAIRTSSGNLESFIYIMRYS